VYPELLEELQKLVASPLITETEFPATFLRSFAASGIETKLKNHVFHLMRSKVVEKWIQVRSSKQILYHKLAYQPSKPDFVPDLSISKNQTFFKDKNNLRIVMYSLTLLVKASMIDPNN